MSLPNFICIGAQKAGTTWLHEMLGQHPAVWLPPLKELHYLSYATNPQNQDNPSDPDAWGPRRISKGIARRLAQIDRGSAHADPGYVDYLTSLTGADVMTEAWYRRVFSYPGADGRIKCDITPAYLAMSEGGIVFAKSLIGNAKLLLIVREPVARLISQLKMGMTRSKMEPTDTLWKKLIGRTGKNRRGDYSEAIPLWQRHFAPDQLLIMPFGDIKTRPAEFMRQIERFMDIAPFDKYSSLHEQVHKTRDVDVPDWVTAEVETLMKPQQDYIIAQFGRDFFETTK